MKIATSGRGQRKLDARSVRQAEEVRAFGNVRRAGRGRGRLRRFFQDEGGTALVEFTLTLPILVAVLTGIFELGIAFNNQLELTQAVGAGAQYLQQIRSTTADPCKDTMTAIKSSAPSLNASNITLTLTMNGNSPVTGSTCSGDQSELGFLEPATVYATYPCNISIYGFTFSSACKLSAQVTEYEY